MTTEKRPNSRLPGLPHRLEPFFQGFMRENKGPAEKERA